jgi:hypothetical protein
MEEYSPQNGKYFHNPAIQKAIFHGVSLIFNAFANGAIYANRII